MIGVYMILNNTDNKKYIGSSVDVKSRLTQHLWLLKNNKHHNSYLQNSFTKLGEKNFTFKILETCTLENIIDRENFYIGKYKTLYNQNGYNLCLVSDNRRNILDEKTKRQLSVFNMCKNNNFKTFKCVNINTGFSKVFTSLVDAANYLINNGYTKGNPINIRQKISHTLRGKKINNGYSGSIRKSAYKHKWYIIN
jgi:group I intron endonuclease